MNSVFDERAATKPLRGAARADGLVFWGKDKKCRNGECWMQPDAFLRRKQKAKAAARKYQERNRETLKAERKAYREKNREKLRLQCVKWRQENRACSRRLSAEWAAKNPDRVRKNARLWAANNRDTCRRKHREWREENRPSARASVRQWKAKNKDRVAALNALRRAVKKNASASLSRETKKVITCFYACTQRVYACSGIRLHVDHTHPLSRGGKHEPSNLQILPEKINLAKYNSITTTKMNLDFDTQLDLANEHSANRLGVLRKARDREFDRLVKAGIENTERLEEICQRRAELLAYGEEHPSVLAFDDLCSEIHEEEKRVVLGL